MKISIEKDFSPTPAGRYPEDGPASGALFRDTILIPALLKGEEVTVDLDGVEGYGSSFLEEAFGGLMRAKKFSIDQISKNLVVKTSDAAWHEEVWSYIRNPNQRTLRA